MEEEPEVLGTFVDNKGVAVEERTGVTHLVHAWPAQGHEHIVSTVPFLSLTHIPTHGTLLEQDNLGPSRDLVTPSSKGNQAVAWYQLGTRDLAAFLSALFKASFPEYHERYKAAFAAGVWVAEDPGPWLGRAVVYKLQVDLHRDGLDDGPTASFPMGFFEGGELLLPDLGAKLW